MIISVNPVYAVLSLISVFLSTSMLFLLANAEFLAMIFIIVYVGAIAVLFLFIVMMVNIKRIEKDTTTYLTIGAVILFILLDQFIIFIFQPVFTNTYHIVSEELYHYYTLNSIDESLRDLIVMRLGVLLFQLRPSVLLLAGLILLVAMVGAIYLTNTKRGFSMKKQLNQLSRAPQIVNVVIY